MYKIEPWKYAVVVFVVSCFFGCGSGENTDTAAMKTGTGGTPAITNASGGKVTVPMGGTVTAKGGITNNSGGKVAKGGSGGAKPTQNVAGAGGKPGTGGAAGKTTPPSDCSSVPDPGSEGPLTTDSYTDGLRDGPDYGTQTMWYPTGGGNPPYPAVTIVPGFMSPESSIATWGPYLASHGIVTLTIGTNTTADTPPVRATALQDALETIKAENAREGSPLKGKINLERLAVAGWSMGGGGTIITVNQRPELKAAMGICAWNPEFTIPENKVPIIFFAGDADTLAGGQSQGFYASIPDSTPKMLFELSGGTHFYANSPTGANGQCGKYGTAWMKTFLEGNKCYLKYLLEKPTGTSDFQTNITEQTPVH